VNIIQKIVKNTTALIIMQVITMGLGLIFSIYLAKYLGVRDFGKYSFALSFTTLLAIIVDIGFNQLTVRELSRDNTKLGKFIGNIIPIKILLSLLYVISIYILINLMQYPNDTKVIVYIFAAFTILNSFGGLFKSIFNAYEMMEYTSFISILEKAIIVFFGTSLLIYGFNLKEVVSMYPFATFIGIAICLITLSKKFINIKIEIDMPFWKHLIMCSIPFGIFSTFITINYRIDTIMLSILKDDSAVGWYNAAYTLVIALHFIPTSFISSIFPLISRFNIDQKASLIIAYEKSLKILMMIAFPLTIGTIILADRIILETYGKGFENSIYPLQILILSIIPIFIHNVLGAIILAIDKEKNAIPMWALCTIINVTLNYILIPHYGIIAACITTLISEIIICLQFYYFVNKNFYKIPFQKIIYKPLIGGLLMGVFLLTLKDINLIVLVLAGSLVYFITIYKIRMFSEDDLSLLKKLIVKH
jgi:O-antigen/teichoic acid export membrane protein